MTADLVIAALNMALLTRKPKSVFIIQIKAAGAPVWRLANIAKKWL